ncbi:MAG: hypothetical protein LBS99_02895, partial [Clostridiales bacterium]|nr:hypothetical protein [Clostridiales bacterium]
MKNYLIKNKSRFAAMLIIATLVAAAFIALAFPATGRGATQTASAAPAFTFNGTETLQTGKVILYDFDVYGYTNDGSTVPGKLWDTQLWSGYNISAASTELALPQGTMLKAGSGYTSEYMNTARNWSNAKYLALYAENKDNTVKYLNVTVNGYISGASDHRHIKVTSDKVYFDYMDGVIPAAVTTTAGNSSGTGGIPLPAGFKGYIKIDVTAAGLLDVYGIDSNTWMSEINFRSNGDVYVDTVVLSATDDMLTPLTAATALFGRRPYAGTDADAGNNIYVFKDFWWLSYGGEYWDGANGSKNDDTYLEYGKTLQINNSGSTYDMWGKDSSFTGAGISDLSDARYLVFEVQNTDAKDVEFNFSISNSTIGKMQHARWFYRDLDGRISYTNNWKYREDNPAVPVPKGFNGYICFALDEFTGINLSDIQRISLKMFDSSNGSSIKFGRVGYTKNDLIRYDYATTATANFTAFNFVDNSRYVSASSANEITPLTNALFETTVADWNTAATASGLTAAVGAGDHAGRLYISGASTSEARPAILSQPISTDKMQLDLGSQSLILFDVKNGAKSFEFRPYLVTGNADASKTYLTHKLAKLYTLTGDISAAHSAPVLMPESDTSQYYIVPANFSGYIAVPFSTLTASDNSNTPFDPAAIYKYGFAAKDGNTALSFGMPYLAKSIKVTDTAAAVLKLTQDTVTVNAVSDIAYGVNTTQLSVTGGKGSGAVTYTVVTGFDVISIDGDVITTLKSGTATVKAVKTADAWYNASAESAAITVTVNRADPTITKNTDLTVTHEVGSIAAFSNFTSNSDATAVVKYRLHGTDGAWADAVPSALGTYDIQVSVVQTDKFNAKTETFENAFAIVKNLVVIDNAPAVNLTYGSVLPSGVLSVFTAKRQNGGAAVAGVFTWKTPAAILHTADIKATVVFTPTDGSNYAVTEFEVTVAVEKLAITVTPDEKDVDYGADYPAFTYTYAPALIGSDEFSGALTAVASLVPGTYNITVGTLTLGDDYAITVAGIGKLTVNKVAPTLTVTYTGTAYFGINANTITTNIKINGANASEFLLGTVAFNSLVLAVGD